MDELTKVPEDSKHQTLAQNWCG